jgi:hypothetical protein
MNHSQPPIVVRATAAALAVFMTVTTLDCLISIAEPEQSVLLAKAARPQMTAASQTAVRVALAPTASPAH